MKRFLIVIGIVLSLAAGGNASANIIYTFSGVTFNDGGNLTGTFTTNDGINSLISYDFTTSTNGAFGFHYTTGLTSFSALPSILVLETPTLSELIQITFNGGLTALGAPILIGQFDSFEQIPTGPHRQITAGSAIVATSVPEPASLALLGLGLIGLGFSRRKRA